VTSPPYWGLRDYGTAKWEGGSSECDHAGPPKASNSSGLNHGRGRSDYENGATVPFRGTCLRCGAIRVDSQVGLEDSPEEYTTKLVSVFREARRVLRGDGTLWLNLGDTINNKQVVGIPWRVAFALQADGWWLRSAITWAKPNPMPESVTDRPTKSSEMVFLLAKSSTYYYDSEAIKEGSAVYVRKGTKGGHHLTQQEGYKGIAGGTLKRDPDEPYGFARDITTTGRNRRDVWFIATHPFPGSHFAVMPEALVEPCILAGTSEKGCCPKCGAPWVRVVAKGEMAQCGHVKSNHNHKRADEPDSKLSASSALRTGLAVSQITTGWRPSCTCDAGDPAPCVVLDMFTGSGTVGAVAKRLGRSFVGIELNPAYVKMAEERIERVEYQGTLL